MSKTEQEKVADFYAKLANLDASKLDNFRENFSGKSQDEINQIADDYNRNNTSSPSRATSRPSSTRDTSSIQVETQPERVNLTQEQWRDIAKLAERAELNQLTHNQRVDWTKNITRNFADDPARDTDLFMDMSDKTGIRPAVYSRAVAAGWVPPTRDAFDNAASVPGALSVTDEGRGARPAVNTQGYYSQDPELGQSFWVPLDNYQGGWKQGNPGWALVRNPETGAASFDFDQQFIVDSRNQGPDNERTFRNVEKRFPANYDQLSGQSSEYFYRDASTGFYVRKPIGQYGMPENQSGTPIFTPDPVRFPNYYKV